MGPITPRKIRNGTAGFTAQIRLKQNGKLVWTEAQTFDRLPAAAAWLERREKELAKPGAIESLKAVDPTLAEVIDRALQESVKKPGKTKQQVLDKLKRFPIPPMRCSTIGSPHIVDLATQLLAGEDPDAKLLDDGSMPPLKPRKPQTTISRTCPVSSPSLGRHRAIRWIRRPWMTP